MATGKPRGYKARLFTATGRALRCARDLYVRGLSGLDRFVAAANPRAGGGRPTSRAFGAGRRSSEQELWELVRAMQASGGAAAATGAKKAERGVPATRSGGVLGRIDEDAACAFEGADAAVARPTSSRCVAVAAGGRGTT